MNTNSVSLRQLIVGFGEPVAKHFIVTKKPSSAET